jgi:tetratricopeptide (TPR) repeat protein
VAIALTAGVGFTWLWKNAHLPHIRSIAVATAIVIIAAGAARSFNRYKVWRNVRSLTLYSMNDAPRSWRVQQAYAELLFDDMRIPEASAAYERSIRLAPQTWLPRNQYAERLLKIHDDQAALRQLELSLNENPGRIETMIRLPAALLAVGDYERARQLADSIIIAENSPPIMVAYRAVADSAIKLKAPPGTVRVFPF